MKKKKREIKINVGAIVTIVLLMSVLILGLFLVEKLFDEPHFKIYEEECVDNYETLTDTITYTIIRYKEEEWADYWKAYRIFEDKHKYRNFSSIWPIRGDIVNEEMVCKKIPILGTNDYGTNCDYFNATVSFSFIGEFYNGSQSCEQVEVDEIDLGEYKEFNFRNGEILTCFNKCYFKGEIDENFSGFIQPKRREEYDIIKYEKKKRVISKQDLTIDWLDNSGYCECGGGCEYECIQEWKIHKSIAKLNNCINERGCPRTIEPSCIKYSCRENYIVEVEK